MTNQEKFEKITKFSSAGIPYFEKLFKYHSGFDFYDSIWATQEDHKQKNKIANMDADYSIDAKFLFKNGSPSLYNLKTLIGLSKLSRSSIIFLNNSSFIAPWNRPVSLIIDL